MIFMSRWRLAHYAYTQGPLMQSRRGRESTHRLVDPSQIFGRPVTCGEESEPVSVTLLCLVGDNLEAELVFAATKSSCFETAVRCASCLLDCSADEMQLERSVTFEGEAGNRVCPPGFGSRWWRKRWLFQAMTAKRPTASTFSPASTTARAGTWRYFARRIYSEKTRGKRGVETVMRKTKNLPFASRLELWWHVKAGLFFAETFRSFIRSCLKTVKTRRNSIIHKPSFLNITTEMT